MIIWGRPLTLRSQNNQHLRISKRREVCPIILWTRREILFFCVMSHLEVKKQVNSRDYITGLKELSGETQVLVLVLHPSSCIMWASACPLGPTGPEQGITLRIEWLRGQKRLPSPEHFRFLEKAPLELSPYFTVWVQLRRTHSMRRKTNQQIMHLGGWRGADQGQGAQRSSSGQI